MILFSECNKPVGMENGVIPDERITASSVKDNEHKPSFARLRSGKAWCSGKEMSPYLQISLSEDYGITGIETQGSSAMWVTKYEVHYKTRTTGWKIQKVISSRHMHMHITDVQIVIDK